MANQQHIDAVKAFAQRNYGTSGWDYVVETMDDDEIATEIEGAKDACEAILKMGSLVKLLDGRRQEVRAEIF
jgi:hypothetical protein